MNPNIDEQEILLGFSALHETFAKDGYIGAFMITDVHGVPQEFRCSHPVKPTAIQKPLYGDTLEPYIGINLCGIPLIESIKSKPMLIVVQEEFLLGVRVASQYPVVFIRRAGEAIEITNTNHSEKNPMRERIDCTTGNFQPIVITPHHEFNEDSSLARPIIEKVFGYFDPIEPFERMVKAIEILGKQDSKFQ